MPPGSQCPCQAAILLFLDLVVMSLYLVVVRGTVTGLIASRAIMRKIVNRTFKVLLTCKYHPPVKSTALCLFL